MATAVIEEEIDNHGNVWLEVPTELGCDLVAKLLRDALKTRTGYWHVVEEDGCCSYGPCRLVIVPVNYSPEATREEAVEALLEALYERSLSLTLYDEVLRQIRSFVGWFI